MYYPVCTIIDLKGDQENIFKFYNYQLNMNSFELKLSHYQNHISKKKFIEIPFSCVIVNPLSLGPGCLLLCIEPVQNQGIRK